MPEVFGKPAARLLLVAALWGAAYAPPLASMAGAQPAGQSVPAQSTQDDAAGGCHEEYPAPSAQPSA